MDNFFLFQTFSLCVIVTVIVTSPVTTLITCSDYSVRSDDLNNRKSGSVREYPYQLQEARTIKRMTEQ